MKSGDIQCKTTKPPWRITKLYASYLMLSHYYPVIGLASKFGALGPADFFKLGRIDCESIRM